MRKHTQTNTNAKRQKQEFRQACRHADISKDTCWHAGTCWIADTQADIETGRHTGMQTCRHTGMQTKNRQAHRQTNRLGRRHANTKTERHAFKHTSELLSIAKRIKPEAHSLITSHQKHAQIQKASIWRMRYVWNWLRWQGIAFLLLDALSVLQALAMLCSCVHDIEMLVSK